MTFDLATVYKRVPSMSVAELDALPCGAIRLSKEGVVLDYNRFESELAGIAREKAIGKNFFTELAPCTDVQAFHGRFKVGVARKSLHEKFRYHFPFKRGGKNVLITLFYNAIHDGTWVFVQVMD